MKKLFLLSLLLAGCDKATMAPDVISVENELDSNLQVLLEMGIQEAACEQIEAEGFECNIPEQIKSIKFEWVHDPDNSVVYSLKFCLKANCPIEEPTP